MLLEQFVRTGVAFLIGIYVARYLGPAQFGLLSYGLSLLLIVQVVARLGMDSVLVREIARKPAEAQTLQSTAACMMLGASLLASGLLIVVLWLAGQHPGVTSLVVILLCSVPLQCFYVVDYFCQAQERAKSSSLVKVSILVLGAAARVVMVWYQCELLWFVVLVPAEFLLTACAFGWLSVRSSASAMFAKPDMMLARRLISSAWPMVFSGLAVILYLRVDQLMIKHMMGDEALGLYSAASKIYEGWVVIPFVLSVAALSRLVKLRAENTAQYERELCLLFALVFWSGAIVAILCSLFADFIILISFGAAFLSAAEVLAISMWAAALAGVGSVSVRYFVAEGLEKLNLYRTLVALGLNIVLNCLLIPAYGIQGAAYSTLGCLFLSNVVMDVLDPRLRRLAVLKAKALLLYPIWSPKERF